MRIQLDKELSKAYARCVYLQLLEIELPESYEDSIVLTQVEVQNSKMKKFEQEAAIIRRQIDILRSENDQLIKLINATGKAEAYKLIQAAKVCFLIFFITVLGQRNSEYNRCRISSIQTYC
jgi:hypothetical protein